MSILGGISSSGSMNGPVFHEFKKQASFFFKEKIKTARLALTDVTPAQLMVEEATNGNPEGPDARTLKMISKAAFEVDDYSRIVEILHKRLVRFERRNWRASYKALIVLEHLLTHGPERVAEEFEGDRDAITEMESFQHIDEKGFDWGLKVRKKSERILKLLVKGPLLKEERDKARKVSRGIQGFGSFCMRTPSDQEILHESSVKSFARCNSEFTNHTDGEEAANSKENLAPREGMGILERELYEGRWNRTGEKKALLPDRKGQSLIDDDHPFADSKHLSALSLLSPAARVLTTGREGYGFLIHRTALNFQRSKGLTAARLHSRTCVFTFLECGRVYFGKSTSIGVILYACDVSIFISLQLSIFHLKCL